jgi:hypothetical protein
MAEFVDKREKALLEGLNAHDNTEREIIGEPAANYIGMTVVEFEK